MPPLRLPSTCSLCPINDLAPVVRGDGPADADVMVISAYPGKDEVKAGKPFSGPSGQLVRGIMGGLIGDNVYFTHLVKRPLAEGTKFSISKSGRCLKHVAEELERVRPKVVVTMGAHVTGFFIKSTKGLATMHGLLLPTKMYGVEFTVLPVYDIGFVLRTGGLSGEKGSQWIDDLEEIRNAGVVCLTTS